MKHLAAQVKTDGNGILVFNPTGTSRSVVEGEHPAIDLPAFGYRFLRSDASGKPAGVKVAADGSTIENDDFRVTFDANRGVVTSVFDKQANRESIAAGGSGNRLEVHWEEPNGMSAWTIGAIKKVEPLVSPVTVSVSDHGIAWERKFQSTTIQQRIVMGAKGPPEFQMNTEWKELGAGDKWCPFLKVAFDVNVGEKPKFTCQIPFGTIERPIDNVEVPAVKWADLSGAAGGAAIVNDSKHGYTAEKNTLRLSLIRSSYYPDERPNDRPQAARWMFHPHAGDWQAARIIQHAEAFNHPVLATSVKPNASGTLPPMGSMLTIDADNVIVTGVKRAEDDDDLVVRFYEAFGKPTTVKPALGSTRSGRRR
jgi:alpha-mannosidase